MHMYNEASRINASKAKTCLDYKGNSLRDALNLGFSYIEQHDHVVHYIIGNGKIMKKIMAEIPESVLDPDDDQIGELWTAKLLLFNKLPSSQIVFSNTNSSMILNLNLTPAE